MMPNMLPKVGPGKAPNVFYNTGHGHLGWTLSAATAVSVAQAVVAARAALAKKPSIQAIKETA
jgi:D-amino-acid dehydrogenase